MGGSVGGRNDLEIFFIYRYTPLLAVAMSEDTAATALAAAQRKK